MNRHHEVLADEELRAARGRLLARGAELRDRLERVRADLGRHAHPVPADSPDAAIVVENDEILEAIEQSALSELDRIDVAIGRLDTGSFALCEVCGGQIAPERLRAVPYATRCHHCAKDG